MQADFCREIMIGLKKLAIHSAVDTSGYAKPEVFRETVKHANLVLFDLKLADTHLHQKHTGLGNEIILENFEWLCRQPIEIAVRIPLIENITDTIENLEGIRKILQNSRIDLLPFHHFACSKYQQLGRDFVHASMGEYPNDKREMARQFFQDLAAVVSIGG